MTQEVKQEQIPQEAELAEEVTEQPQTAEVTPAEAPQTLEAPVEQAKPTRKKKEEEVVEERYYTIPLQKALARPPNKRTPRAMQLLKAFVVRHMKMNMKVSDEEEAEELPKLIISPEVNELVWGRGIEKPPRKIKVRVTKDSDGNVTVYSAENQ
ncbi:MAG: 50S ribosomal protein L31e [Methanocella sp.]|jgi:large subunit ribosomal protein L31e